MPDFPGTGIVSPKMSIGSMGLTSILGDPCIAANTPASSGAVWPTANKALFLPFILEFPVLAQKMGALVTTQAGNYDLGIYDEKGNKIVTFGGGAVPAAGLGTQDIADTALVPGVYYMAMACSSGTAAFQRANPGQPMCRISGVNEMTTAYPLPATLTFTVPSQNYFPAIFIQCNSVL